MYEYIYTKLIKIFFMNIQIIIIHIKYKLYVDLFYSQQKENSVPKGFWKF